MATEGKYTNEEFDAEVEELVSRTELFIEENKKTIIYPKCNCTRLFQAIGQGVKGVGTNGGDWRCCHSGDSMGQGYGEAPPA